MKIKLNELRRLIREEVVDLSSRRSIVDFVTKDRIPAKYHKAISSLPKENMRNWIRYISYSEEVSPITLKRNEDELYAGDIETGDIYKWYPDRGWIRRPSLRFMRQFEHFQDAVEEYKSRASGEWRGHRIDVIEVEPGEEPERDPDEPRYPDDHISIQSLLRTGPQHEPDPEEHPMSQNSSPLAALARKAAAEGNVHGLETIIDFCDVFGNKYDGEYAKNLIMRAHKNSLQKNK